MPSFVSGTRREQAPALRDCANKAVLSAACRASAATSAGTLAHSARRAHFRGGGPCLTLLSLFSHSTGIEACRVLSCPA